jgi:hypothetical protein
MSKNIKRIQKLKKYPINALALGTAFGALSEYIGLFSTIFVIDEFTERQRHRTIVYRDNIESLSLLVDIDIIFVDTVYFAELKNLHAVWRKSQPIILTQGTELPDKKIHRLLNSEGYWAVESIKQYMIWKLK